MRMLVSEPEIKQQKDHPTVSSQMAFKQVTNEGKKARSVKNHEEAKQPKVLQQMYPLRAIPTQELQILSPRS